MATEATTAKGTSSIQWIVALVCGGLVAFYLYNASVIKRNMREGCQSNYSADKCACVADGVWGQLSLVDRFLPATINQAEVRQQFRRALDMCR